MKKLFLMLLVAAVLPVRTGRAEDRYPLLPAGLGVRNVILCVGDGMGLAQVLAARVKTRGKFGRLAMERMPVAGLVNTCSADALITDSAAAGTALASGVKTNNGMIGMDPEGRAAPTILEACKKRGMATGLVATSAITHATPASFASHVAGRSDEAEIAVQLLQNRVDVLLGGGRAYFIPSSTAGSGRSDRRDLIREARKAGYAFVRDRRELERAGGGSLLGLFQLGALTGDSAEPSLADMTRKAIDLLGRDDRGLFLMVEGSQIDWACHGNDLDDLVECVGGFDLAVRAALDFAARDSHTVVVVTADHETGGLGIVEDTLDMDSFQAGWLTTGHTAVMAPLFAFGPGAEAFTGLLENTEIPARLKSLLNLDQ